jgi:flagellin-like protein
MTNITTKQKMTSRRAVAPIIATLLLVAIAVVGGSIIFVFSQGFFSAAQVSGSPNIESLKFTGYDAADGAVLTLHDNGNSTTPTGIAGNGLIAGEKIGVYVQNNSVQKVTLNEVRFAGAVYTFQSGATDASLVLDTTQGKFMVATKSNTGAAATTVATTSAEIQPGQQATVILELADNIKVGRDAQFKMITGNGAVFVGTVIVGQTSG